MPPKKIIEYTVFVIDCRFETEKKLEQLYSIYSTKTFSRATKTKSADQQKIILINSPVNNSVEILNDWSFYQLPFLQKIQNACLGSDDKKPMNHNNLLKGLNESIKSLSEIDDKKNIIIKRIIVLTDLLTPINKKEDNLNKLKSNLKLSNATLYIIGVDINIPKLNSKSDIKNLFALNYFADIKNPELQDNLNIIRKLSDKNILVWNFEDGYHLLFSYKAQIKDPYPWYVGLGIGTDFRVPVLCYKVTRKHVNVKSRPASILPNTKYSVDRAWFDLNSHEEIPFEDIVRGYRYHGKFVSFTGEQEKEMESKKKINKCLNVVGFVDTAQIPIHLYGFENSMHKVKPDRRSVRGKLHGFRLFVAGLRARNAVAIVKRVYNNGNRPNLFVMFPCPEHHTNNYLLMCQIPYAHQFKDRYYKGTDSFKIEETESKQDVYAFLDAMTADTYENGKAILPLTENLKFNMNRARQYKFIAKKNLEEDPGNPPELDIHPFLKDRAEEFAENLIKLLDE